MATTDQKTRTVTCDLCGWEQSIADFDKLSSDEFEAFYEGWLRASTVNMGDSVADEEVFDCCPKCAEKVRAVLR